MSLIASSVGPSCAGIAWLATEGEGFSSSTKNVRVGFACENGTDGLCFGSLIGIHVTKLCGKRVRVQRNTDSIQSKATPA